LFEPIFGRYQVSFSSNGIEVGGGAAAGSRTVLKTWNLVKEPEEMIQARVSAKYICGYVPKYTETDIKPSDFEAQKAEAAASFDAIKVGDPKTLNHIAVDALAAESGSNRQHGLEALGVLKADLDYLGLLMACGLKPERLTVSRLATLSRQLNFYFSIYLPHFLKSHEQYQSVYTVFAGGDDLFLIGPWNKIIDLSGDIWKSFSAFVCGNPEIHFSAGISIHKAHTTIDSMAAAVESALERSKSEGRDRLTLFSQTVEWTAFEKLMAVRDHFESWLDQGWISRVLFYRFNELIRMAEQEKQVVSGGVVHMTDMRCTKWRAMLAYTAQRNVGRALKDRAEREKAIKTVMESMAAWLEEFGGCLIIPVWYVMYNRR
jgi:CRISPR-associated protein Csm1